MGATCDAAAAEAATEAAASSSMPRSRSSSTTQLYTELGGPAEQARPKEANPKAKPKPKPKPNPNSNFNSNPISYPLKANEGRLDLQRSSGIRRQLRSGLANSFRVAVPTIFLDQTLVVDGLGSRILAAAAAKAATEAALPKP